MGPIRRLCVVILGLTLAASVSACIGADDPEPRSSAVAPSDGGGGVISEDSSDTVFVPGRFIYRFNSITAQATFDGSVATMSIRNDTGAELGAPSLYVLGADDRRHDGVVEGAAPIPDGEQATLEFTFPDVVTPQTIGLAVLSFGELNVGAMAPMPASGA